MLSHYSSGRGTPRSNPERAPRAHFVCTAEVKGAVTGNIGRCGCTFETGTCPDERFHLDRPVPFSLRSVSHGPAGFYYAGVRHLCSRN
ncbi:MAG: hypothetical protein Athens041674_542 [Parcubacteria group bacterium Athens0416_74]|nr:MAG: hypothetical protein Athens041674_542 [Parcubacteria group bacterium Athens0416_74]